MKAKRWSFRNGRGWCAAAVLLVAGCGFGRGRGAPQSDSLRAAMEQAHAMSRKISVDLRNSDLREALGQIARKGRLSVALSPNVQGRVNVLLKDASVRDALIVLMQSHRLAYDRTGSVYNIMTEAEYVDQHGQQAVEPLPGSSPPTWAQPGRRVSLDTSQMDLVEVLRFLANAGDLDVIIDQDVTGQAAVRLEDVRAADALESVVRTNSLAYRQRGSIFHIMTSDAYQGRYGQKFGTEKPVASNKPAAGG